jgi:hypothetical protein
MVRPFDFIHSQIALSSSSDYQLGSPFSLPEQYCPLSS